MRSGTQLVLALLCAMVVLCVAVLCCAKPAQSQPVPENLDCRLKADVNSQRARALVEGQNASALYLIGTAIWVEAWLINDDATQVYLENQRREAQGQEHVDVPVVTIGAERLPWVDFLQFTLVRLAGREEAAERQEVSLDTDWRALIPRFKRKDTETRELSWRRVHIAWVIPPELSRLLAPGTYELTARFDSRAAADPAIAKLLLQSEPLRFELRAPANREERAQLLLSEASYVGSHLQDWARAEALARSAQETDPGNMDVHRHLGAIYRVQRRWQEAINEYSAYLAYLQAKDGLTPGERIGLEVIPRHIEHMRKMLQEQGEQRHHE